MALLTRFALLCALLFSASISFAKPVPLPTIDAKERLPDIPAVPQTRVLGSMVRVEHQMTPIPGWANIDPGLASAPKDTIAAYANADMTAYVYVQLDADPAAPPLAVAKALRGSGKSVEAKGPVVPSKDGTRATFTLSSPGKAGMVTVRRVLERPRANLIFVGRWPSKGAAAHADVYSSVVANQRVALTRIDAVVPVLDGWTAGSPESVGAPQGSDMQRRISGGASLVTQVSRQQADPKAALVATVQQGLQAVAGPVHTSPDGRVAWCRIKEPSQEQEGVLYLASIDAEHHLLAAVMVRWDAEPTDQERKIADDYVRGITVEKTTGSSP